MKRGGGFTLGETVVASAIFLVFMVMATSLLTWAFSSTRQGEQQADVADQAAQFMYRISTELRSASYIIEPDLRILLTSQGSDHLVFCTQIDGVPQIVAYALVPDAAVPRSGNLYVQRTIYGNDYVPEEPESQRIVPGSQRLITHFSSQISFALGWGPELSTMMVAVAVKPPSGLAHVLRTRVIMRRHTTDDL